MHYLKHEATAESLISDKARTAKKNQRCLSLSEKIRAKSLCKWPFAL
jgi:hypothetical protein